jgi:hypothetical protein
VTARLEVGHVEMTETPRPGVDDELAIALDGMDHACDESRPKSLRSSST